MAGSSLSSTFAPRIERGHVIVIDEYLADPMVDLKEHYQVLRVDTMDRAVRTALIELGWTPPPDRAPQ